MNRLGLLVAIVGETVVLVLVWPYGVVVVINVVAAVIVGKLLMLLG